MAFVLVDQVATGALLADGRLCDVFLNLQLCTHEHPEIEARITHDGFFLTHKDVTTESRFAVLACESEGFLSSIPLDRRGDTFSRILQVVMSKWDSTILIPHNWKPYHRDSLISFQTNNLRSNINLRAYVDMSPLGEDCPYLFLITDDSQGDLSDLKPDYEVFIDARDAISTAMSTSARSPHREVEENEIQTSFSLDRPLSFDVTRGRSLQEWYEKHLTREQLRFVDAPLRRSIRLRGAAGTGKTLALVVKFLRTSLSMEAEGKSARILFLAHSFATVDMIRNYILNIDPDALSNRLQAFHQVKITTLHDIANEKLSYDLLGIDPLALDGHEGRKLQMELIESILLEYRNSKWIRYRDKCTDRFRARMNAAAKGMEFKSFVFDVMNEFACVIDAFGSKNVEELKTRYSRESKLVWMLASNSAEKSVLLDVYLSFRTQLREMKTISTDQMTADFLGYLDSFRWSAVRSTDGYDLIFVDELHLFNRQERLTLHLLTRLADAAPVVVMAYDPKQSPRDTFLDLASSPQDARVDWKDTNLGEMEAFEFVEIFRYTPQIEAFLQCLDQSFPAENFGSEWAGTSAQSMLPNGPKPKLHLIRSTAELYRSVFDQAKRTARTRKQGRQVAVLCLSYETFHTYLQAGALRQSFVAVTSRDELSLIAHSGKRFIFSMPEHVAGLQFETVYLIDANVSDLAAYGEGIGAKRRFVSNVYLGASRAETNLEIFSVEERGGLPQLFEAALATEVLVGS